MTFGTDGSLRELRYPVCNGGASWLLGSRRLLRFSDKDVCFSVLESQQNHQGGHFCHQATGRARAGERRNHPVWIQPTWSTTWTKVRLKVRKIPAGPQVCPVASTSVSSYGSDLVLKSCSVKRLGAPAVSVIMGWKCWKIKRYRKCVDTRGRLRLKRLLRRLHGSTKAEFRGCIL